MTVRIDEGPPYMVLRIHSLAEAREIAASKHPSRVAANTHGYRYAQFRDTGDTVEVTMMGGHIATFEEAGIRLWARGYRTPTTSAALSALSSRGFSHDKGILYSGRGERHEEGQLYPYPERRRDNDHL